MIFDYTNATTASEAEAMTMNFHVTKRRRREWKGTVQRTQ